MLLLRRCTLPLLLTLSASAFASDDSIRINQIQVIGTHNSYHAGFAPSATKVMMKEAAKEFAAINYRHPSLTQQFDDGVRQIELDVFSDSKGGMYGDPAITHMVSLNGLPDDPPMAPPGTWEKPGFKVMHIQDVDFRTNCITFIECLTIIRTWSRSHPDHVPILITMNTNDSKTQDRKSVV